MPFYIAAYDTEAIYPWWELGEQPYSAQLYKEAVRYEGQRLHECLDGVRAVANVHLEHKAPATFFIVAKLVEAAGAELRAILDHSLFDLQCHTFTHENLLEIAGDEAALRYELVDAKHRIEDAFGRAVIGLTTPGAFPNGLVGQTRLLEIMWDAGYRYVRSVGKGPFDTLPAPLTEPFWYSQAGYPDLLELPLHAWHDNVLTGQPFPVYWPPILPWGYPARQPQNAQEIYEAYAPGIDYIAEHNLLTYTPCFHPWSIYRADQQAKQIDLLLTHAETSVTVASCIQVYEQALKERSLVSEQVTIA
ncbi:polysaccharide deacetylase family protein [Chloroflexi bacterium TSY]|nr:polysaccharide deacetylase family protein [Chloroflexi bacterium TSY]